MKRPLRRLRRSICVLACLVWLPGCGRGGEEPRCAPLEGAEIGAMQPPVVFIVVDTLRADHLPFYGYRRDTAPFLNELARGAVLFRHAHSPSSWTAPAAASIFTSLYPHQHHVYLGMADSESTEREYNRVPDSVETIAELFRENGYATFGVADNPNISHTMGFGQGFDRLATFDYAGAAVVNETLIGWQCEIERAPKAFVYLHYMDPHHPYHRNASPGFPKNPKAGGLPGAPLVNPDWYDSEIRMTDTKVRELFGVFGWGNDVPVVFTSDHGEEFGEHGGVSHGQTLYGEVLDVPFFIRAPSRTPPGGRVVDERVSTLDLLPTLVDLFELESEARHEGRSLRPLMEGRPSLGGERPIYAHLVSHRPQDPSRDYTIRSLISGKWKLILDGKRGALLYNLEIDPGERTDVAPYREDVVEALTERLLTLEAVAAPTPPQRTRISLTPEQSDRLRALGYVE